MVEAAIVTPLLFVLIFSIIEFSLYTKDKLTAANAARLGARAGSAQGNAPLADWDVIQNVVKGSTAWGKIDKIIVFKGTAGPNSTVPAACTTAASGIAGSCNIYTTTDFSLTSAQFTATTYAKDDFWPASSRITSLASTAGPDYLGVWVSGTHPTIVKSILNDRIITEQQVMRLEPTS